MNSDRLIERIRELIGDESARSFANSAGVSDSTLRSILSGSKPTVDTLIAIARAGDVSVDWLATGEGPKHRKDGHGAAALTRPAEGFVYIPRYDVAASAGHGSFNESENVVDYMAFREDWVRRALQVDPRKLVLITAIGDSMEPAIRAGDLLLIDTGVERILDDAIYVLVKRGELIVKRVQQFFNGAVVIKSDNHAYVEETLGTEEARDLKVAGRVRWIGRLI